MSSGAPMMPSTGGFWCLYRASWFLFELTLWCIILVVYQGFGWLANDQIIEAFGWHCSYYLVVSAGFGFFTIVHNLLFSSCLHLSFFLIYVLDFLHVF